MNGPARSDAPSEFPAAGPTASGAAEAGLDTWETLTESEFEHMVQDLANPLMGTAMRLCRHHAEAEDLVQETLFRALRGLASFRKGSRFKAWMFRILHNVFINRSRREARAPTAVDPAEISIPDQQHPIPDLTALEQLADVADRHFDEQVKTAVDALPEVYRVPIVLFALGDLSYAEIAASLDIPIGTVMSRLHRARKMLKERLTAYVREERLAAGGPDV